MNPSTNWLAAWLLSGSLLMACITPAKAEPGFAESIEWIAADSDLVVLGSISNFRCTPREPLPTDSEDVKKEGAWWCDATIDVTECLKGPRDDQVRFRVWTFGTRGRKIMEQRMAAKRGHQLLFFLVRGERYEDDRGYAACPWALRPRGNCRVDWDQGIVDTADEWCLAVVTADFRVLTRWEDILQAARTTTAVLHDYPAGESCWVTVPGGTEAYQRLWGGSVVSLQVPDTGQESLARGWLMSNCQGMRFRGIQALRRFPAPENVRLLKGLLNDPVSRIDHRTVASPFPVDRVVPSRDIRHRHYPIRAVAYDTLSAWGVTASRPVADEPLGVPLLWRVSLVLVATAGVLIALWFWRRRALRTTAGESAAPPGTR